VHPAGRSLPYSQHSKKAQRHRELLDSLGFVYGRLRPPINDAVNHMTVTERLTELERQHKALDHEIAEALGQTLIDDLKITELKRRKLMLKDQIERLRHDHAL
jgi:hypothetical protein